MKKIILFLTIFLLTGCSANYNLEITETQIKENITVAFPKNEVSKELLTPYVQNPNKVYPTTQDARFYNSDLTEDTSNYYLAYDYNHSFENFKNSLFAYMCYEDVEVNKTETNITLKTSNEFNCMHMDDGVSIENAKINIKTDLNVESHNADTVNGNIYTWYVDNANYKNKPINMDINIEEEKMSSFTKFLIVISIIGLIIIVGGLFVINEIKKNNSL